jgi:acetyl-CoA synthetase
LLGRGAAESGSDPLVPRALRVTFLDYYGLTESYPLVGNYPFLKVREGSMGKPMPGWDVQILDEDERPVAQGERGEICLRARSNPHYPLGYWGNERQASRCSAATGSTQRTRPYKMTTVTTGTLDVRTT